MHRIVVLVALVAGVTVGLMNPAFGGLPAVAVDPDSGVPGDSFTVSGAFCTFPDQMAASTVTPAQNGEAGPFVEVTVAFPTPLVETTNADATTGEWSVSFTVPAGTPPGPYDVTATCFDTPPPVPPGAGASGDVGTLDFDYVSGVYTVEAVPPAPGVPGPAPEELVPAPAAVPAPAVAAAPRFTG